MIISSTYGRGNKYFQRTRRPQRVIDRTGLLPTLGDAGYSFPGRELCLASAVDEAVVARFVPRSGCNVAGGPSDKPGYEAMLVRSIGTADRARHRPPRSHLVRGAKRNYAKQHGAG
jgi:hypothetical protein